MQIEYAKVSALGDRSDNQDRAAIVVAEDAALMLVFDGMGGHSDGALAAETGLNIIQEMFMESTLPMFDPQGFIYTALARAHLIDPAIADMSPVRAAFLNQADRTGRSRARINRQVCP